MSRLLHSKRMVDDFEMTQSQHGKRVTTADVTPTYSNVTMEPQHLLLPYPVFGMNNPGNPISVEEYQNAIQNIPMIEARQSPLYKTNRVYRSAVQNHRENLWNTYLQNSNLNPDEDIGQFVCSIFNSIRTVEELVNWINTGIPPVCEDDDIGEIPLLYTVAKMGPNIVYEFYRLGYLFRPPPIDSLNQDPESILIYGNVISTLKLIEDAGLAPEMDVDDEDYVDLDSDIIRSDNWDKLYHEGFEYIKYLGLKLAGSYIQNMTLIDPRKKAYMHAYTTYYESGYVSTESLIPKNLNVLINTMYPVGTETPGIQPFDSVMFGRYLRQATSLSDLQELVRQYGHRYGVYSISDTEEFTMASVAAFLSDEALDFAIRFHGELPESTKMISSLDHLCMKVIQAPFLGDVAMACERVNNLHQRIVDEHRSLGRYTRE